MYKIFTLSRIPLRMSFRGQKFAEMSSTQSISDPPSTAQPAAITREVNTRPTCPLKYADIGINLGDSVFQGIYHGKKAHECDLKDVIQRATAVGCVKMMVTGSDLKESRKAVKLAEDYRTLVEPLNAGAVYKIFSYSSLAVDVFRCSV